MRRTLLILLMGLAVTAMGAANADPAPVDGTWQRHQDIFTFSGFTSHYSCEGLETKLKLLLAMVGARPGYHVAGACADPSPIGPRITVVRLKFDTLAPAASASAATSAPPEAGRGEWRTVDWNPTGPRELQPGDCELVEQFAREILPMFTTRDVENHMTCVPNAANLSGIRLKFNVLAALPEPKRATLAKTQ